jgi:bacterioferritin
MSNTAANPNQDLVDVLNRILELELAGVVRYLHYSVMVFGHNRIPICKWLREQSDESQGHAVMAGEHVTTFGGHPSLKIGELLETLKLAEGRSILLEEYARDQIAAEEMHLAEITKMMRRSV